MTQDTVQDTLAYLPAEVVEMARSTAEVSMTKPNLFLVPPASSELMQELSRTIYRSLCVEFPTRIFDTVLPTAHADAARTAFICIAVDSSRPEKVKDIIKEQLWMARNGNMVSGSLRDVLTGTYDKTVPEFKLEEYGVFVPFKTTKSSPVKTRSFHHNPTFYRYRAALDRLACIPDQASDYLQALFTSCPNHLFNQGGLRASAIRQEQLSLEIPLDKTASHDMVTLARASVGYEVVKSRHENLQKFLLQYDPKTVASEVPVWVESWELKDYPEIFKTDENLTGHIDVLRCEDGDVMGVWDYKPNAADEQSAAIQVFLYALMLSLRTGLPIGRFVCGYFDECNAYVFRPSEVRLTHEY